LVPSASIGRVP